MPRDVGEGRSVSPSGAYQPWQTHQDQKEQQKSGYVPILSNTNKTLDLLMLEKFMATSIEVLAIC